MWHVIAAQLTQNLGVGSTQRGADRELEVLLQLLYHAFQLRWQLAVAS